MIGLTAGKNGAGVDICKKWTDGRGCHDRCPDGKAHCCDLVLAKTRKVCGGRHRRIDHKMEHHGAVAQA